MTDTSSVSNNVRHYVTYSHGTVLLNNTRNVLLCGRKINVNPDIHFQKSSMFLHDISLMYLYLCRYTSSYVRCWLKHGIVFRMLVGHDSSVRIATHYGLDGPGIESWWRRDFPHLSRPALGPTQPPIQWIPGFSRG